MREIAAYFMIQQIQDTFAGIREETADQHGWYDMNPLAFVLSVVVITVFYKAGSVFVVGQFQKDGAMKVVF